MSGLDSREQASFDFEIGVDYPPNVWKSGEIVRDQYIARIPADLPSGQYSWYVKLVSPEGHVFGEYEYTNSLRVNVPERLFDKPNNITIIDVELGNVATLSGYNINNQSFSDSGILKIKLVWEATANIPEAFHVFVHIIDESGNLIAQSDGEPAGWTRPTTGWLPGEYVVDSHEIILPTDMEPGSYNIYTGLYNNKNYQRLISDEFIDGYVKITEFTFGEH
tara:strand:- start:98 stop:760 length:663 start_codon:yes stop_codon:yes gene_type:complete